ncbi:MAG: hypothetical protein JO322_03030 [Candidatus Eremiobacteraeota bacterium]|nr:hypothetical protein [Candidatus Eremiobacteraeota bacterium]
MDATLEITAMPAPQWLFGYDITEEQRLLFARLYLEYAHSSFEGPIHEQPRESLSSFLDRCTDRGLTLAVPRELAIDILRRPDVFGWSHAIFAHEVRRPLHQLSSVLNRSRELLTRPQRRFVRRTN